MDLTADDIAGLRTAALAVVADRPRAPTGVCSAQVDHVAGGEIAAARLLAIGRERIAFVTGVPEPEPCVERRDGAARAIVGSGLPKPVTLIQDAMSPTAGRAAAARLLEMSPRPDGVFCANDLLAIGLINELAPARRPRPRGHRASSATTTSSSPRAPPSR